MSMARFGGKERHRPSLIRGHRHELQSPEWLWPLAAAEDQVAKLGKEAVVGSKREDLAVTSIGYDSCGVALGPGLGSGEAGQPPGPPGPM